MIGIFPALRIDGLNARKSDSANAFFGRGRFVGHRHHKGEDAMKYTNPRGVLHRAAKCLGLLASLAGAAAHASHPGDPDGSFGAGGYLTTDFVGTDEQVYAVAPMRDGRFIAAGVVTGPNASGPGGSPNAAVARYLPNGTLDATFGVGGLFNLDVDAGPDEARAVNVLSDNSVLVAVTLTTSAHADFGLLKLRTNGTVDTNFGEPDAGTTRKGYVRLDIGGAPIHDEVFAMATQSDGRIIVAGRTRVVLPNNQAYTRVAVARFTATGDVDTSFGGSGSGYLILPAFLSDDNSDYLTGIALDQAGNLGANNSIVLVGYTFGRNNAFITRLTATGTIDATFGNGTGRVIVQAASSGGVQTGVSMISAARLTREGQIVILGEGNDRGLTVMRFAANGAADTAFGTNGRTTIKYSISSDYDEPAALALQGNGKIVAAGYATNRATGAPRKDFFVTRMLANGAVDSGFGDGQGRAVVQISTEDDGAFAAGVEPSGNLLIGGYQRRAGTVQQLDFALLRLFGDPDRIFANGFDAPGFQ
jgi:uncharacterized delta-60 repeat protein